MLSINFLFRYRNQPVVELAPAEGGVPFLTPAEYEELSRGLSAEHAVIARITPYLRVLCREVGLVYVNSEEWRWVHALGGQPVNDETPDGAVCICGLYDAQVLNASMTEIRNPTNDFIFGFFEICMSSGISKFHNNISKWIDFMNSHLCTEQWMRKGCASSSRICV